MEHLVGSLRPDSNHKLTLKQACGMLEDLIKLYQAPDFQRKMSQLYAENATEDELEASVAAAGLKTGSMIFDKAVVERRRELCMPVQAKVIPQYGFEATQAGVLKSYAACMQNEIWNAREFQTLNYVIGLCIHFGPAGRALEMVRRAGIVSLRWQELTVNIGLKGAVRGLLGQRAAQEPGARRPAVRVVEDAGRRAERRQRLLDLLEADGSQLQTVMMYRRDPDAVLAAVSRRPEALRHASLELIFDLAFAREALRRNWQTLEFMPHISTIDKALTMYSLRQSPKALQFAHRLYRRDPDVPREAQKAAKEAAFGSARYEGEYLRLAGYCCGWRLTDSCLRFSPLSSEDDDDEHPISGIWVASKRLMQASFTHRLTVQLRSGRLSFQIFSCLRGADLKVYPEEAGEDGFFRLPLGDREGSSAVVAVIGDKGSGRGQNFFVEAEAGQSVSIYVELATGASVGDFVNVWCVLEGRRPPPWVAEVASVWQDPCRQRPRYRLKGSDTYEAKVFEDVEDTDRFHDLIRQAFGLNEDFVSGRFEIGLITGGRRLTLLVDAAGTTSMGYCLYTLSEQEGCLWIENLLVLGSFRRRGVGKALLRWASARAASSSCTAVRLKSNENAMPFYKAIGFEVVPGKDELMELKVLGVPRASAGG